MIPKISWQHDYKKENPFGGTNGFRDLRITFHSGSFNGVAGDDAKVLEMLYGLARLDDVDALSFDGEIFPKAVFGEYSNEKEYIDVRIIDQDENLLSLSGTPTRSVNEDAILYLLGTYISSEVEKNEAVRQDLLRAETNYHLHRDLFVTLSPVLLKNRNRIKECNVYSPLQALKLVGLYLRVRNEFELIYDVKGKARFVTDRYSFYELLSKGLVSSSWKYLSSLSLHVNRDDLIHLGRSIIERFSRALQARDELARLFYMPNTSNSEDQKLYHFDYLTLLLTATLDAQALIINKIYGFGLSDSDCGLTRKKFKKAVKNDSKCTDLNAVIVANNDFIEILHKLRNKIHSVSLDTNVYVPDTSSDELLEAIYQYDTITHWGVEKNKVTLIKNNDPPVPSYKYSTDIYILACNLVVETCNLINSLMDETRIENYLDKSKLPKVKADPPADMAPHIQAHLLLA